MEKFLKPILAAAMFLVADLATGYLLKSVHPIIYSIFDGIGFGYSIYTLALLFSGIWLSRYIFRTGKAGSLKQTIIISCTAGIGVGTLMTALIQVSILLL